MRWKTGILTVGIVGVAALLAAMGTSYVADRYAGERQLTGPPATPELIARGAYLAQLGDCAACHSIPGKPPYSGGLGMVTPIGAIYTTNITPDPTYGIGGFSLADFDRALRFGVAEGHTLYPAMPFTSYYNTTPEDVAALYAYFQHGVPAAAVSNRPSDIPFPLSMRWPLTYWRWFFAPKPAPFKPLAADAEIARGAYFVEGLGHCGECHTPRGFLGQMELSRALAGAPLPDGHGKAANLRGGDFLNWTDADIVEALTSGFTPGGDVLGAGMTAVVRNLAELPESDRQAIAVYLKSLPPLGPPAPAKP